MYQTVIKQPEFSIHTYGLVTNVQFNLFDLSVNQTQVASGRDGSECTTLV